MGVVTPYKLHTLLGHNALTKTESMLKATLKVGGVISLAVALDLRQRGVSNQTQGQTVPPFHTSASWNESILSLPYLAHQL